MPGSERRDPSVERTLVVGGTGSGKTELAGYLTRGCSRLLVYDTKAELGGLVGSVVVEDPNDLTFRRREVFQPPGNMAMDHGLVDEVMQRVLLAGDVMVWIDESTDVSTSQKLPPWLGGVLRKGRSKRIGVIALTQRDVGGSHPDFFAQSQHLYVGHSPRMSLETLRKRVEGVEAAERLGYASGRFLYYPLYNMALGARRVGPVPLGSIR